ncbi:prohibitin family protein [Nonlabens mediterrranea]|uniref:Prohibitin family protein n=1 Tax=Nonlabens mediterrranea TaxID=1419947 RepID=A0ABS0A971_9FLAO|nr:prohibitin family protein [Nonlabens mediterrranea]
MEKLPKAGLVAIIAVVLLIIVILKSSVVIGAGQAGVLFKTLGNGVDLENTYGEGFHIIAPWNDMIIYPTRQQSISDKMQVLSVNGLEVKVDATVWYMPEYDKLPFLHQEKGRQYESEILAPAISAAARSVVGRYTPEQLYSSKRDVIQAEILEEVQKELETQYVIVNRVLVKDVTLPIKIKEAIERKLKQEQESLEYEFRLTKATKEAERQKIDAEGKAVANRILSASLTDKILTEKGIEATLMLSQSPNSKVIVIGGSESGGLPIILGNQ